MPLASELHVARRPIRVAPSGRHPIYTTPTLDFIASPIKDAESVRRAPPAPGELLLWRYRAEWRAVSPDDLRSSLSTIELQRAKSYPNSALAKRYLVGCTALRHVLSRLLACQPEQLAFADEREGRLRLLKPSVDRDIEIHMAYAGIWILIAISAAPVGISAVLPAPVAAKAHAIAAPEHGEIISVKSVDEESPVMETRLRARASSLAALTGASVAEAHVNFSLHAGASSVAEIGDGKHYQVLDLPMPGRICSAVALTAPVWTVHAAGWPRG